MLACGVSADWREQVGWQILQHHAGASLPTGSGVNLEMAEAGTSYMPNTADASFSGITFTNISNISNGTSGHATGVGRLFFGDPSSLLTGVSAVGIYSADSFINDVLKTSGIVGSSSAHVMNHAYIGAASAPDEAAINEVIKRFDFLAQDSGVLHIVGANNGSSNTIPPIFNSAYNAISVGRSDGSHSHGSTPANYPGSGRQKPDLVMPLSTTSSSTGALSSIAALLRAKAASSGNADATHPDTLKAVIMAGATKHEFPGWSQTSSKPLDVRYGAGEAHVYHSYRIIEQAESTIVAAGHRGWVRDTIPDTATTHTYSFTCPAAFPSYRFSTALIWQRDVTGDSGTYTYQNLANLKLELLDATDSVIQTSDSLLDSVEHIWKTDLTPGATYKLRVSSTSGSSEYSLAWRTNSLPQAAVNVSLSGNDIIVNLSNLTNGTNYLIQRSSDLKTWVNAHGITATSMSAAWTDTGVATNVRVFYRVEKLEP